MNNNNNNVTFNIYSDKNLLKVNSNEIGTNNNGSDKQFNIILILLFTYLFIILLIALLSFITNQSKSYHFTDDANYKSIIIWGLQGWDLFSDFNLSIEILLLFGTKDANALIYFVGTASILFCLIPYFVNIIVAANIKHFIQNNSTAKLYFERRYVMIIILTLYNNI